MNFYFVLSCRIYRIDRLQASCSQNEAWLLFHCITRSNLNLSGGSPNGGTPKSSKLENDSIDTHGLGDSEI